MANTKNLVEKMKVMKRKLARGVKKASKATQDKAMQALAEELKK